MLVCFLKGNAETVCEEAQSLKCGSYVQEKSKQYAVIFILFFYCTAVIALSLQSECVYLFSCMQGLQGHF